VYRNSSGTIFVVASKVGKGEKGKSALLKRPARARKRSRRRIEIKIRKKERKK